MSYINGIWSTSLFDIPCTFHFILIFQYRALPQGWSKLIVCFWTSHISKNELVSWWIEIAMPLVHWWNMIHLIIDIPGRTSLWLYSWYPHLSRAFSQGWPTLKFLPISIFVAFNATTHMPLFLFLLLLFSLSMFPFSKFQPFYKQIPKTIEGARKIR